MLIDEAETAYLHNLEVRRLLSERAWDAAQDHRCSPPQGWTFLGSGSSRSAYLAPSGTVYKVLNTPPSDRWRNQSDCELENYLRLVINPDLPESVRLPVLHGFKVEGETVIGCEQAPETDLGMHPMWRAVSDLWYEVQQRMYTLGVGDLAGDNVKFDGKQFWLVDLGM